jgi:hypothetical protein
MQKNLSVWNRLFVVFVILWTIFAVVVLTDVFRGISRDWHIIEKDVLVKSKDSKTQELTKSSIRRLMKEEKRDARILFVQLWILPIVLVYCLGQITGWIVKEYCKEGGVE